MGKPMANQWDSQRALGGVQQWIAFQLRFLERERGEATIHVTKKMQKSQVSVVSAQVSWGEDTPKKGKRSSQGVDSGCWKGCEG